MPEGGAWKNVNEQDDWLKTKRKILAYITQVLANRLRSEFPSLPAQVVHLVYMSMAWSGAPRMLPLGLAGGPCTLPTRVPSA